MDVNKISDHARLLTKNDLLLHADLYARHGFSREWILTAPIHRLTVQSDVVWTGCSSAVGTNDAGLCPEHGLTQVPMTEVIPAGTQITVIGDDEKWIALMCGNFVPRIDVEKVGLTVVDAQETIPADTDVSITVRSVLRNNGPYGPISAVDETRVTAHSPDCTVTPATRTATVQFPNGQDVIWDAQFTVRCNDPSNHSVSFANELRGPTGFYETNLSNQIASTTWNMAVLYKNDISVTEPSLTCAPQTMVGNEFKCQGAALVTNTGPHGTKPMNTRSTLDLTIPPDCTVKPSEPIALEQGLTAGASVRHEAEWTLNCADRSFHDTTLTATAGLFNADVHASDPNPNNNQATAVARTEVFETVDLETEVVNLQCSEREHNMQASQCTATVRVTNNGPADEVITDTDVRFDVEETCTALAAEQTQQRVLGAGTWQDLTFATQITCDTARRHIVTAYATLHNAPSDPHAVDTDSDHLIWVPSDIKPRSLPSAVNVGKAGLVPLAILGTAEFDPLTQVDRTSLTFGTTGSEKSDVQCKAEAEDVNDDGYPDLVCHSQTKLTAITCESTELVTRGRLVDGQRFISQDAVKPTGCQTKR